MSKAEEIMAEMLSGRDWHKMSKRERQLVVLLEQSGHLEKNEPTNGFVGKVKKTTLIRES